MNSNFMQGLPPELRSFVSSSEELLEQFNVIGESDRMTCRIFIDSENDDVSDISYSKLVEMFLMVDDFVRTKSADYLWFRDRPKLHMILPATKASDRTSKSDFYGPYLESSFRYGDSIDDEWFLTYILLLLSQAVRNVSVSCADNDGQYLLIEAAEHIPSWLSPHNCQNRIWLRAGEVHIIPLDEGSVGTAGGISLPAALSAMKKSESSFKVTPRVMHAVQGRTTMAFPSLVAASKHNVVLCLPVPVAVLLQKSPQLVADIINAFCATRSSETTKAALEMTTLNSLLQDNPLQRTVKNASTSRDLVCTKITLTRLLYSKMMFSPFRLSSLMGAYQDKAMSFMDQKGSRTSAATKQAAELSCRFLCGLELLLLEKATNVPAPVNYSLINDIVQSLDKNDTSLKHLLKALPNFISQGALRVRFCGLNTTDLIGRQLNVCNKKGECSCQETSNGCKHLPLETINKEISRTLAELASDIPAAVTLDAADDDSWMHLTPEELELEMQTRSEKASSYPKGEDDKSPVATVSPCAKSGQIDGMLTGMKTFFDRKSGIEGPDDNRSDSQSDTDSDCENNSNFLPESTEENLGALDIDFDKLLKIVEGGTNIATATTADVPPHCASDGIGSGHIPPSHLDEERSLDEILDSDDESQASFGSEEGFDDAYAQIMEEELRNSTLSETFECDDMGAVDIDKNLMKNMFESHASQDGAYGPASQLFSQLGLHFPVLPKGD